MFFLPHPLVVLSYISRFRCGGPKCVIPLALVLLHCLPSLPTTLIFLWHAHLTSRCKIFSTRALRSDFWSVPRELSAWDCCWLCNDPRMWLVKDRDSSVPCSLHSRVRELIERHGMFCVLKCTPFDPAAGYSAVFKTMTVYWTPLECVGWFPYSLDTGVVHPLAEYRATVRDNVISA